MVGVERTITGDIMSEQCKAVDINGTKYIRADLADADRVAKEREGRIAAVVFTDYRGVFFGWVKPEDERKDEMTLTGVRNCIYWAKSVGGVFGLASDGPNDSCRIGALMPSLFVKKVHGVVRCTKKAIAAWEGAKCYRG